MSVVAVVPFPESLLSMWSSYSLGPSVLVSHKGPTFVNEGARWDSTDFTGAMKIRLMCRMVPDHMAWIWEAKRQTW
jgi:hypothetical protein